MSIPPGQLVLTAERTVDAVRVHAAGDLRLDRLELAAPQPNEAVVRIAYGGICGSDIHYWRHGAVGASVLRAPMVLGHEVVGTIAQVAADGSGPTESTAVVVHPAQTCGVCQWCRGGREHLCPKCRYLGSAAQWPHTDGGFATWMIVPTARLVPIPDGLDLRRATLAEPTAIAWHAVSRAEQVGGPLLHGTHVLIVGAGPIGLLIAAIARHRGADSVTVTDLHARPLQVAARMGADRTPTVEQMSNSTLIPPADIVFESSGAPAGLAMALRAACRGGTVVAVGQLPLADSALPASQIVTNELTVTGSLRMAAELPASLRFLADSGSGPDSDSGVEAIISHEFALNDLADAFEVAADPSRSSKVLLRF
jgi:L-idonate 5-dehydrogenase